MLFFTLPTSQHAAVVSGGGFFSWGTKFKYTGRTEREILTESINILREQKLTNSSASKRKASSVPATPSSPQGDLAQIRYSSLPRSTMSEPLSTYNLASTDVFNQNLGYDTTGSGAVLVSGLEPVSEEARLKTFQNINFLNNRLNSDLTTFFTNSEDSMLYSSTGTGKFGTYENQTCLPKYSENLPNSSQQECSTDTLSNFSNISISGGSPTSEIQYNTSAKAVRKFHFINAFIPSFIFVVFAMMISAIIVLESDSDLFEQIRNLPEMISLRYQYYEPLKEYLLQKVGQKT